MAKEMIENHSILKVVSNEDTSVLCHGFDIGLSMSRPFCRQALRNIVFFLEALGASQMSEIDVEQFQFMNLVQASYKTVSTMQFH